MPELIIPEEKELAFRRKMLENPRTMDYLGHTVPFPEEEWGAFYHEYVLADPSEKLYRLIYCPGCEDFVGSVSYALNHETGNYEMELLIDAGRRMCGYGRWALGALKSIARKHGIPALFVRLPETAAAAGFLERYGFRKTEEDAGSVLEYCKL